LIDRTVVSIVFTPDFASVRPECTSDLSYSRIINFSNPDSWNVRPYILNKRICDVL